MHPIHYSMFFNFLILAITGALSFAFAQPMIFIAGVLLMNHMVGKFDDGDDDDEPPGAPMGFGRPPLEDAIA